MPTVWLLKCRTVGALDRTRTYVIPDAAPICVPLASVREVATGYLYRDGSAVPYLRATPREVALYLGHEWADREADACIDPPTGEWIARDGERELLTGAGLDDADEDLRSAVHAGARARWDVLVRRE